MKQTRSKNNVELTRAILSGVIFLLLGINQSIGGSKYFQFNSNENILFSTVTVGQRTSDSTGTLSISATSIQQSLLSTIPYFSGYTIYTSQVSLSMSQKNAYLVFKVVKPANDTLQVAVELTQGDNNSLIFQPHSYSLVLFYTVSGNCIDDRFLRDRDKFITGCTCNPVDRLNADLEGCKYSMIKCQ
ncbi:MAG TPA: hypothetical protein VK498_12245 [Ferruginibacter sp.]|nr:hypothetical protein [Ferruginibacter sp.]